jgi:hypothetical protein
VSDRLTTRAADRSLTSRSTNRGARRIRSPIRSTKDLGAESTKVTRSSPLSDFHRNGT